MSEGQYQRQHEQHCGNNNKFHGATLTGKISGNLGHWYCGIYVHRKWCTYSHFRTVESYKTQSKGRGRNTCECCWCYRYRWMIYVGVRSLILFCSVRYQYWYRWRWVWLGFVFACCESASCFHSRSTCCYRIVFLFFFSFFADHYFLIDAVFECIFRLSASCFFMNGTVLKVDFFYTTPQSNCKLWTLLWEVVITIVYRFYCDDKCAECSKDMKRMRIISETNFPNR